jgi:hypothetical protein
MRLPAQHVEDATSAADFYANKVLMEWRAKDPAHAPWVAAVKALLQGLKVSCSAREDGRGGRERQRQGREGVYAHWAGYARPGPDGSAVAENKQGNPSCRALRTCLSVCLPAGLLLQALPCGSYLERCWHPCLPIQGRGGSWGSSQWGSGQRVGSPSSSGGSPAASDAVAAALQAQRLGFRPAQLQQWLDHLTGTPGPSAVLTAAGQHQAAPLRQWLPRLLASMQAVPGSSNPGALPW